MVKVEFGCCYCEEAIEQDEMLSIGIYMKVEEEGVDQYWWAHPRCFVERLGEVARANVREEIESFLP